MEVSRRLPNYIFSPNENRTHMEINYNKYIDNVSAPRTYDVRVPECFSATSICLLYVINEQCNVKQCNNNIIKICIMFVYR